MTLAGKIGATVGAYLAVGVAALLAKKIHVIARSSPGAPVEVVETVSRVALWPLTVSGGR